MTNKKKKTYTPTRYGMGFTVTTERELPTWVLLQDLTARSQEAYEKLEQIRDIALELHYRENKDKTMNDTWKEVMELFEGEDK